MFKSLLFSTIIVLVIYTTIQLGFSNLWHSYIWFIVTFYVCLSYFNHILLKLAFSNNRENFVQFFLSTNVVRMILSLVFVGVFANEGIQDLKLFVIDFFVLYLFYTSFEIYILYRKLQDF